MPNPANTGSRDIFGQLNDLREVSEERRPGRRAASAALQRLRAQAQVACAALGNGGRHGVAVQQAVSTSSPPK